MKISELQEAIHRWAHAGSDITKMRAARAAASHTAKLVSLKKDGEESQSRDATTTYPTEAEAKEYHARIVRLNPTRNIRHNLYVDNKLVGKLDTNLTEVRQEVGSAAEKVLAKTGTITPAEQQKHIEKFKQLQAKAQELAARPDAQTGKYAKELNNLEIQKTRVASAGNLNAFGKPMLETASSGSMASGSFASVANPMLDIQRRPSLFGYVPSKTKRKSTKSKSHHK